MPEKITLENFIDQLADDKPTPGGGAAAALAGALGVALLLMTVKITLPKISKGTMERRFITTIKRLEALRRALMSLIDEDVEAYAAVVKAYKLVKTTPKQISHRQHKIQTALKAAVETPLKIAILSFEAQRLLKGVAKFISKNLSSDKETADFLIEAAIKGALANVRINLPGIKDKRFKKKIAKSLRFIKTT